MMKEFNHERKIYYYLDILLIHIKLIVMNLQYHSFKNV